MRSIDGAPSQWARGFAGAFLAAVVICGLVGIEAWPLTGWHLFSRSRPEHAFGFDAFAVAADGSEQRIPFDRMRSAYHGSVQILGGFSELQDRQREAVCRAWAAAAEPHIGSIASIRIYRTDVHLSRRDGRRGVPSSRRLVGECAR